MRWEWVFNLMENELFHSLFKCAKINLYLGNDYENS